MNTEMSQTAAGPTPRFIRSLNTLCFVLNVLAFGLAAHVTWFARPRFGIMFAEQNRPLPWITDVVLQTPGWVYMIPFSLIAVALVAKEFIMRRYGVRLLINSIVLFSAFIYFILMIVILFMPLMMGDLMRGAN